MAAGKAGGKSMKGRVRTAAKSNTGAKATGKSGGGGAGSAGGPVVRPDSGGGNSGGNGGGGKG